MILYLIIIRLLSIYLVWSPRAFWLILRPCNTCPIQLCIRCLSLRCSYTKFRISCNINLNLISLLIINWSMTVTLSLIICWSMILNLIVILLWSMILYLIIILSRSMILCLIIILLWSMILNLIVILLWSMILNLISCRSRYSHFVRCWSRILYLSRSRYSHFIICWS